MKAPSRATGSEGQGGCAVQTDIPRAYLDLPTRFGARPNAVANAVLSIRLTTRTTRGDRLRRYSLFGRGGVVQAPCVSEVPLNRLGFAFRGKLV